MTRDYNSGLAGLDIQRIFGCYVELFPAGNDKLRSIVECLKQSLWRLQTVLEMPQMRQFRLKSDTLLDNFQE